MKLLKKIEALFAAATLMVGVAFPLSVAADTQTESNNITVYVTVSDAGVFVADKNGEYVVRDEITLSGQDNYTLIDVMTKLHEDYYVEGASGFGYSDDYGSGNLVNKLWGEDTSLVGFYVNDKMAWSLDDAVEDGADIDFFIYDDSGNYESYTYFNKKSMTVNAGDKVELNLYHYEYDENYNAIVAPVSGADLYINGEAVDVEATTDDNGYVSITTSNPGVYIYSAVKYNEDGSTAITAPYCVVKVVGKQSFNVSKLKKTYKASALKKKKKTFKLEADAATSVTFKKISGSKKLSINKKGKVTVKKNTKAGKYKMTISATAAASDIYNKTTIKKQVVVTVK